jgi:hypothetical protein
MLNENPNTVAILFKARNHSGFSNDGSTERRSWLQELIKQEAKIDQFPLIILFRNEFYELIVGAN